MKKVIATLVVIGIGMAGVVIATPAEAKTCGIYYVSHQSKTTGHFTMRKLYRCSR